ncbi:MAG TPA: FKBP-type peptidyl-prolyl cis-trans isomerase [Opitutus sp.]|nr:FKBP-type peptidyl-prolyl cis-trans isomerase [Opitutus sp.]
MKSLPKLFCTLLAALALTAPLLRAQLERLTPDQIEYVNKKWPGTKKTSTGIRYIIQKEGDGDSPKGGDTVGVCYVGTLLDGKKFDEHLDPEHPLDFRIGRGEVITGWDQILPAMKLHEKRLVIIPSDLAYGSRGRAPDIPRDAVLVFEMELISIKHPE